FKDGITVLGTATVNGSGAATFTTTNLSASGSPHSIIGIYNGDSNFHGSSSSSATQNVAKATLTVTADNKSRTYGSANPAFTASYSGFVNGESSSVLSGSPSLTTSATCSSPIGTYTIAAGTR